MMSLLNVSAPKMQPSIPEQKSEVAQPSTERSHTQEAPASPGTEPAGPRLKINFRFSDRQLDDSPGSRLALGSTANALANQSDAARSAPSTSPGSHQLSQSSISSRNARSPTTTASSVMLENGTKDHSPVNGASNTSAKYSSQVDGSAIDDVASESPSTTTNDGVGRVSSRARKPTSKAQALADAGTRFYRRLQGSSEGIASEKESSEQEVNKPNDEIVEQESIPGIDFRAKKQASPDLPQSSVEQPIAAVVRSSPRQRKPTAKAAASGMEPNTLKRTASPSASGRSTKIVKISLNTPREPSKLRTSLSTSTGEDSSPRTVPSASGVDGRVSKKSKVDEASLSPSQIQNSKPSETVHQEVNLGRSLQLGPRSILDSPSTFLGKESISSPDLEQSPKQVSFSTTSEAVDVKIPEAQASASVQPPVASETAVVTCELSCLTPAATLLAFARFAAAEESDSGDDYDDDAEQGIESTNLSHDTGLPGATMARFVKFSCLCSKKAKSAKAKASHTGRKRNKPPRDMKSSATGSRPKRTVRNNGASSPLPSRHKTFSPSKSVYQVQDNMHPSEQPKHNSESNSPQNQAPDHANTRQIPAPQQDTRRVTDVDDESWQYTSRDLTQSRPRKVLRLITKPRTEAIKKEAIKKRRSNGSASSSAPNNSGISVKSRLSETKSTVKEQVTPGEDLDQASTDMLDFNRPDKHHNKSRAGDASFSKVGSLPPPPESSVQNVLEHQHHNSTQGQSLFAADSPKITSWQKIHKSKASTGRGSTDYMRKQVTSSGAGAIRVGVNQRSTPSLKITLKVHTPST